MVDVRRWWSSTTALIAILVAALALRVVGLGWSLPSTYEEATPLKTAVAMWGWPAGVDPTLNPCFFNYPSLTFYVHFVVQGVAWLILKATGHISSPVSWYVQYLTDPTPMYLASRFTNAVIATLTVFFIFKLGKTIIGSRGGLIAALLLATSPYHIARSQMIDVDIPLTCFVVLAMYGMALMVRRGGTRSHVLAGITIGLAASCKYTGWLLLLPFLVAGLAAPASTSRWRHLGMAVLVAVISYVATSPYTIIEWSKTRASLALEREHMRLGHFGSDTSASWQYYAQALPSIVGVIAGILALAGAVRLLVRKERRAYPALAFVVLYLLIVSTWAMKAERYLLPVLPLVLVFTAAALAPLVERGTRAVQSAASRSRIGWLTVALLLLFNARAISGHREHAQSDARDDAQAWIEENVPPASFIVSENYGPDLLNPSLLIQLSPEVRREVLVRWKARPLYAHVALPMYQTRPERSGPFYSVAAYPEADYFITTNAIRRRYERDPERFGAQVEFYADLEKRCEKVNEFSDAQGARILVYRPRERREPFGKRLTVSPPPVLRRDTGDSTGREAGFYFTLGTDYEYFKHLPEATESYRLALAYGAINRQLFSQCVFRYAQCLVMQGKRTEALTELGRLQQGVRDSEMQGMIGQLIKQIESL
ncbi:MAG TPA: glycosyltransferase family 39 protein [Candidatus Krumholzibacteria bacterium]